MTSLIRSLVILVLFLYIPSSSLLFSFLFPFLPPILSHCNVLKGNYTKCIDVHGRAAECSGATWPFCVSLSHWTQDCIMLYSVVMMMIHKHKVHISAAVYSAVFLLFRPTLPCWKHPLSIKFPFFWKVICWK